MPVGDHSASVPAKSATVRMQDSAELRLLIPAKYRDGHESHFAAVTRQFLAYWADPKSFPASERTNMMAKYYVTTTAVGDEPQVAAQSVIVVDSATKEACWERLPPGVFDSASTPLCRLDVNNPPAPPPGYWISWILRCG